MKIKIWQKSMRCSKNNIKREVYSNIGLAQETRKVSNNLNKHKREQEKEQIRPKSVKGRK